MRRAWALLVVGSASAACDPVPFASVELALRAPEGAGDRLRPASCDGASLSCLQLSRVLDGGDLEALSLTNEFWGPTKPLPLGTRKRDLELELFTGAPEAPTLLARADPVVIPAIDEQGSAVTLQRTAVLAAFDTVEPFAIDAPAADTAGAACDDGVGNAWFFGAQAWSLSAATLEPRALEGLFAPDGASFACAGLPQWPDDVDDVDEAPAPVAGRFFAFVGDCAGGGGGTLFTGTDAVDDSATIGAGAGCHVLVAARDHRLWVVQDDVVTVHDAATLERLATQTTSTPAQPFVDAIVRSDGAVLVAEADGGTRLFSHDDGSGIVELTGANVAVARFVAIDGAAWALTTGGMLRNVDVDGGSSDVPELGGLTDVRDVVALRDGTLIVLGTADNDGTPFDALAVMGAGHVVPTLVGRGRNSITKTVGGAVLLWGGVAGVDVFVPSAPTLLAARTGG